MSYRRLKITGSAVYHQGALSAIGLFTLRDIQDWLRRSLVVSGGWVNVSVSFQDTSGNRFFCPCPFAINIEADVPAAYSNREHLDFVGSALASYVVSILGVNQTRGAGVSDIRLQVISPATNQVGFTPEQIQNSINQSQSPVSRDNDGLPSLLGTSAGTLLVGGALLLFLLKK